MTTKREQLVYLVAGIVLAVLGVAFMVIASVSVFSTKEVAYSHNLEIKEIETQLESVNGVTYHYVTIDGDINNNTDEKFDVVSLEIIFAGIDNKSGQYAEFVSGMTIEEFNAHGKVNIQEKVLKVGNHKSFVPESIKSIKIILSNSKVDVSYVETNEGSLLLFGGALVVIFVSGLLFAKWNNKRKNIGNEVKSLMEDVL